MTTNTICPCGSKIKYKKCCQPYHKGKIPKTALALMMSRYTAYKLKLATYIMNTTHKDNSDFTSDEIRWKNDILSFSNSCDFEKLEIFEFIDGEVESYVTFRATINCEGNDSTIVEKSRFVKEFGKWYYINGDFLENL